MELNLLRNQIDQIDDELVSLFVKRMELSSKVADYKQKNNLPIYVPAREQEILASISSRAGDELSDYAQILYSMIFELSRTYQRHKNCVNTPLFIQSAASVKDFRSTYMLVDENIELNPGEEESILRITIPAKPNVLYKLLNRIYAEGIAVTRISPRPLFDTEESTTLYIYLAVPGNSPTLAYLLCQLHDLNTELGIASQ